MTINEVIDKTFALLGDKNRNYWETLEIEALVQEAIKEYAEAGAFITDTTLTINSSTNDYTLPSDIYKIKEATDSSGIKWKISDYSEYDKEQYQIQVKSYNSIYIPYPIDTDLKIIYFQYPSVISEIPLPERYAESIKYYAASRAYLEDDEAVNQQKAQVYNQLWLSNFAKFKDNMFRNYSTKTAEVEYQGF